ncbi:hypothetical protein [Haloprofundus salilacus]|uniref:hypothetical protein n=1 Tax=Haloprofundus salilacus TaxID=2876190 RepID=UPI001CCAB6DF|nr:hypothetical protein [Haloprofundus salilacus]
MSTDSRRRTVVAENSVEGDAGGPVADAGHLESGTAGLDLDDGRRAPRLDS